MDSTEEKEGSAMKVKHEQTQTTETTEAETQTPNTSKMSGVEVQTNEFE